MELSVVQHKLLSEHRIHVSVMRVSSNKTLVYYDTIQYSQHINACQQQKKTLDALEIITADTFIRRRQKISSY